VVHAPPNINVSIPIQSFSISGVIGDVPASAVVLSDIPPAQHRVFFVIERVDQNAMRDVLQSVAGTLQIVSKNVVYRIDAVARIEKTDSPDPITPAPPPALGPSDIGYIEYCTVIWDGAVLTTIHNSSAVWQFPGGTITVGPHGITHLPSGTDPVPVAVISGSPSGSDPGLMPAGSFAVLKNCVQNIIVSAFSPYIVRVVTGDNTPGNPKRVELRLRTTSSFTTESISGDDYLGLNFKSGPYAGSSPQPARSDHGHSVSESPVALVSHPMAVDETDLDILLMVPDFSAISTIYQTQVFWRPTTFDYPMIACGWIERADGTIGARAHILGSGEVRIETGSLGFVHFNDAVKAYVISITGGVVWSGSDNAKLVRSGDLLVRLIGEKG
jgi:hypothetical protein